MLKYSRDENEGAYNSSVSAHCIVGGGGKSLLSGPGSELRVGGEKGGRKFLKKIIVDKTWMRLAKKKKKTVEY